MSESRIRRIKQMNADFLNRCPSELSASRLRGFVVAQFIAREDGRFIALLPTRIPGALRRCGILLAT